MTLTPRERFTSRCRPPRVDGCIRWKGKLKRGYGQFHLYGHQYPAHVAGVLLAGIRVPRNHHCHHKCHHKWCVNIFHIEVIPARLHQHRHRKYPSLRACLAAWRKRHRVRLNLKARARRRRVSKDPVLRARRNAQARAQRERNHKKYLTRRRIYDKKNRAKLNARMRAWRRKNRDHYNAQRRARYARRAA